MAKVSRVEAENKALERQLDEHDTALTQLNLTRKQLAEVTTAYSQVLAECQSLKRQAEHMVTHIASLKKVPFFACDAGVPLLHICEGYVCQFALFSKHGLAVIGRFCTLTPLLESYLHMENGFRITPASLFCVTNHSNTHKSRGQKEMGCLLLVANVSC